jgi:hypothetical protein
MLNKQSQMLTISFLSTKNTILLIGYTIKMTASNNTNNNNNNNNTNNKIQLTITTGTTEIILDIVGTLTVSQVINNKTTEAAAGVPLPASPSILSPPTKTSKKEDDKDADSYNSGSSTKYEEDDIVPKMASLKLKKKNGKDFTKKSAIKKTSNITFDDEDDDYIEDNQFSQQHHW